MKDECKKKGSLLNRTFSKFLGQIVLWTFGCLGLLFFFVILNTWLDFQWLYDYSPEIYYFFRNLFRDFFREDFFLIFLFFLWIFGVVFMVYHLIKRLYSYIQAIADASEVLFHSDMEYVELPQELEDIQKKLNFLKRESLENEKRAKDNESRKNDLIVYLAHDLKTPLTSLIGYLSLLDEIRDMPKKKREKYIQISLDKSYKLEDLINELFEIARFNSEKIILEAERIDLSMMLEQIVDDFYPLLQEQKKEIEIHFQETVFLMVDSNQMARVFGNLFKNAIFYSNEKIIGVDVEIMEDSICVVICNKGRKIPSEKLSHIFEKFYRADSSRMTKTGGSGLGLAIAKEIVEAHGGRIWATSDEEVTKFFVELPYSKKN